MSNTKDNSSKDIWSYIGKIGILISMVWASIQVFNNFFKSTDYEAKASGTHSFYETSPKFKEAFHKAYNYKELVKTIILNEGSLKNYELDSLLNKKKSGSQYEGLGHLIEKYDEIDFYTNEHNQIWTFTISNTGNKPLEELALELPFNGSYKITLPNNTVIKGDFKNKVSIGELRPSYETKITIWTNSYNSEPSFGDEDKSRFTHKFGSFSIKYPVEVKGLYAWNKRNDDIPLTFFSLILLIMAFLFGYKAGVVSVDQKKPETDK